MLYDKDLKRYIDELDKKIPNYGDLTIKINNRTYVLYTPVSAMGKE